MPSTAAKRRKRLLDAGTSPAAYRQPAGDGHAGVVLVDGSVTQEPAQGAPRPAHEAPGTTVSAKVGRVGLRSSAVADRIGRLLNTSEDPRVDFERLHERPTGDTGVVDKTRWTNGSSHPLSSPFVAHLDRMVEADEQTPEEGDGWGTMIDNLIALRTKNQTRFDAARDRLIREQRPLAECVERVLFGRESLRATGLLLRISHSTVKRRVERGAALLVAWCSDEVTRDEGDGQSAA